MAAGMGSRYGKLKQVDPLGPEGNTIIDYSVYDALQAGFARVVFVIRKQIEQEFLNTFAGRFQGKIPFSIVYQELHMLPEGFTCPPGRSKPWGTAHALWVCRNEVKEPFVVINADDFYGRDAYRILVDHLADHPSHNSQNYAMCAYRLDKTLSEHGSVTRGVCQVNENGYLLSVDEQYNIHRDKQGRIISQLPDKDIVLQPQVSVSMNIWAFNPSIFPIIENRLRDFLSGAKDTSAEMHIPGLVDQIVRSGEGSVRVLRSGAQWFGVTYIQDRDLVASRLQGLSSSGEYPLRLWD